MSEWEAYEQGELKAGEHLLMLQRRLETTVTWRATVKWDGCVHLSHYFNGVDPDASPELVDENSDYLHICDLEAHIKQLQSLLESAKAHFGQGWPDA